jgi:hypothetical protein
MGCARSCFCKTGSTDDNENNDENKSRIPITKTTEPSPVSESTLNIHSSAEILDDNFKNEIIQAIEEHIATVPNNYQVSYFWKKNNINLLSLF